MVELLLKHVGEMLLVLPSPSNKELYLQSTLPICQTIFPKTSHDPVLLFPQTVKNYEFMVI
jgi:hypothetical protein